MTSAEIRTAVKQCENAGDRQGADRLHDAYWVAVNEETASLERERKQAAQTARG